MLQSDASPAFAAVANEISKQWGNVADRYVLREEPEASNDIAVIQRSQHEIVVAIGIGAAVAAKRLHGKRVIFCQVFNYEEAGLISPWMKGVSAVPPVAQQFRLWKKLDPTLSRVGVITGPRLQGLLMEAHAAAKQHNIELTHLEVSSDLEMLYAFKRLSPRIQALWLVPDNRVLSGKVLRDLLTFSHREGKQVLVFNTELLSWGGLISVESEYSDIAGQVLSQVSRATTLPVGVPGVDLFPLTKSNVKINLLVAKRLGLSLPDELKGMAYVP